MSHKKHLKERLQKNLEIIQTPLKKDLLTGDFILKKISERDIDNLSAYLKLFFNPLLSSKKVKNEVYFNFSMKFLRRIIDVIVKCEEHQLHDLVATCKIVTTVLLLTSVPKTNDTDHINILKLFFHILKQFYQRSSFSSVEALTGCLLDQLSENLTVDLNNDVKTFLYTIHQMCYATYVKMFNAGEIVHTVFHLRINSLLVLSSSDIEKYSFFNLTKEFFLQWTKTFCKTNKQALLYVQSLLDFMRHTSRIVKCCQLSETFQQQFLELNWLAVLHATKVQLVNNIKSKNIFNIAKSHFPCLRTHIKLLETICDLQSSTVNYSTSNLKTILDTISRNESPISWLCDTIKLLDLLLKDCLSSHMFFFIVDILQHVCLSIDSSTNYADLYRSLICFIQQSMALASSDVIAKDHSAKNFFYVKLTSLAEVIDEHLNFCSFTADQLKWLSHAFHKLSGLPYNEKDFKVALIFSKIAVNLFESWSANIGVETISEEFGEAHTKYTVLINCYLKTNTIKRCGAVSDDLLAHFLQWEGICENHVMLLKTQVEFNVQIKMQLLNNNEPSSSQPYSCLWDRMKGNVSQPQLFWLTTLRAEYDALKSSSSNHDVHEALERNLDAQIKFYEDEGDLLKYSMAMVQLSMVRGTAREERFQWCKDALNVLEGVEKETKGSGNIEEWHVKDVLALTYFQLSFLQYEDKVSQVQIIDEFSVEDLQVSDDFLEEEFVVTLNTAIGLWTSISMEQMHVDMNEETLFNDPGLAAECLYQGAIFYSLQCQTFNAIKASLFSGMIFKLLNQTTDNRFLDNHVRSWSFCATQFLEIGDTNQAQMLLDKVQECNVSNELLEAAILIRNGKIASSICILKSVIEIHEGNHTRTSLSTKAEAYHLFASLKLTPAQNHAESKTAGYHIPVSSPFPPMADCLKYLRSVYLYSIDKNTDQDNSTFSKSWIMLDKLIMCLLYNSDLYKQQGSIVEARAFLKEGLQLARKFHLSIRIVGILQSIASLDLLLQNEDSFNKYFGITKKCLSASIGTCFDDDDVRTPVFMDHSNKCSCVYCTNPSMQELHIQTYLQFVESQKCFSDKQTDCFQLVDAIIEKAGVRFTNALKEVKLVMGKLLLNTRKNAQTKRKMDILASKIFSKYQAKVQMIQPNNQPQSMMVDRLIDEILKCGKTENSKHEYYRIAAQLRCLKSLLCIQDELFFEQWNGCCEASKTIDVKRKRNTGRRNRKTRQHPNDSAVELLESSFNELEIKKKEPSMLDNFDIELFTNDLEKTLRLLNPYTDTLIIKSIYNLVSLLSGFKRKHLTISCQVLQHARTLHQQVISFCSRMIKSDSANDQFPGVAHSNSYLETCDILEKYSDPQFVFGDDNVQRLIDQYIPADWCVVNMSLSSTNKKRFLIISRVEAHKNPMVMKIDLSDSADRITPKDGVRDLISMFDDEDLLEKFQTILRESAESMKMGDRGLWWKERVRLDKQMKSTIERLEDEWVGGWKGFLLGNYENKEREKELNKTVDEVVASVERDVGVKLDRDLCKVIIDACSMSCKEEIRRCVCEITPTHQTRCFQIIWRTFEKRRKSHATSDDKRHVVVLVLDKYLQELPWESIPTLRKQTVVRMPSLLLTAVHCMKYKNLLEHGVSNENIFYVLNPSNDLKRTEAVFADWFKSRGWQGVVGEAPTTSQYKAALTSNDIFIYCGHGSGQQYLSWESIQQLQCRAVAIVMGCGSGKLKVHGEIEAYGMVQYYLLAGSPTVVGNLWNVTDRDIDQFLTRLLEVWMSEKDTCKDIATCVSQSREACRLDYLIGSAPIVYGLPLIIKSKF